MRLIILSSAVAIALSGCGSPAPASKASPSEIFALRTECGKMGESWLMRHPLRKFSEYHKSENAKVFYASVANRCWMIVDYLDWQYSVDIGQGPRSWPSWARHRITKDVTESTETLRDIQTGSDIMSCRRVDRQLWSTVEDCQYIRQVAASDL